MYPEVSEKLARLTKHSKPIRTPYSAVYVPTVKTSRLKRDNRYPLLNKPRKPRFNDLWGRGFLRTNALDQSGKEFFRLSSGHKSHVLALLRWNNEKKISQKKKIFGRVIETWYDRVSRCE